MMDCEIIVYGTTWCTDCLRTRRILDREKIPYRFINIEFDKEAASYVTLVNHGNLSVPTIVFQDGSLLVEPNERQLLDHIAAVQVN
ncbi:MAG TPA: glutaredoxin domain-containing protein [Anaerolineaceae bacterium]|nr:glutaredoxin domain-containing protein [Anaerolineaceae bacterium]